jgi:predicted enzyme related to lactoylglutathione lyase
MARRTVTGSAGVLADDIAPVNNTRPTAGQGIERKPLDIWSPYGKSSLMTLRIQSVSFDSRDPGSTADFWEQALGWRRTFHDDDEVVLEPPAGSAEDGVVADILFLRVPEEKAVKNRLHLDLRPEDQQAEVERLLRLGAVRVDVGQDESATWVVLADPEGNEFCVLRAFSPEELAKTLG